jgi:hypothetical protein
MVCSCGLDVMLNATLDDLVESLNRHSHEYDTSRENTVERSPKTAVTCCKYVKSAPLVDSSHWCNK